MNTLDAPSSIDHASAPARTTAPVPTCGDVERAAPALEVGGRQRRDPDRLRLAVIPGDGIGSQVTHAAMRALDAALVACRGPAAEAEWFDYGSDRYLRTGGFMPQDGLDRLAEFDAILFGAVGSPAVPDHVSLWGLRLAICQGFDQGICVRPARLLPNIASPLRGRDATALDFVVVRENTEGEYSGAGGRVHRGREEEVAIQTSVYSRRAVERVARYGLELARRRPAHHLCSVTKSNASQYASVLWDEVVSTVGGDYPDVTVESVLVDAMAARLVTHPGSVDVLVASNLHADILSDLTAAITGGLGIAPSANLSCDPRFPSMFEPVHGSAPDLPDPELANPLGALLSAALLLEHVGEGIAAGALRDAVEAVCVDRVLTPDVGGTASCADVTGAVVARLTSV